MKVAILVPEISPASGGSSSFVNSVLPALILELESSNIQTLCVAVGNSRYSKVMQGHYLRMGIRYRIGTAFRFFMQNLGLMFRRKESTAFDFRYRKLNSFLASQEVSLVVSLEPINFVPNIPYFTVVWDLAHRSTPFFPELIEKGEFHRRENLYSQTLPRAARVFVGTDVGKNEIQRYYGVAPLNIVVNPLPCTFEYLESFEIRNNLIFYPAQFWSHKNHVNLLHGLRKALNQGCPETKLIFTGSDKGNLNNVLKIIAELKLEKYVDIEGFVSKSRLMELYLKSGLMIFPTFIGPDNLPPLEAIALGCPVAVSDIEGAREQLGDSAIYFNPSSIDDIAQIISLAAHKELTSRLNSAERREFYNSRSAQAYARNLTQEIKIFGLINL